MQDARNPLSGCSLIDLTHTLEEQIPVPSDLSPFFHNLLAARELGDPCHHYQCVLNEHSGTHVDAPAHFMPRGGDTFVTIDQIPPDRFLFPCAVIPIRPGPGGTVSPGDIHRWETENGALRSGEGVFFHTGWDARWATGREGRAFLEDWPGLSGEAARDLVERGVRAVGTDCLSIDAACAPGMPAHHLLLENGVLIFENLANLGRVRGRCFIIALPLPIKDGTASPVRVIAAQAFGEQKS